MTIRLLCATGVYPVNAIVTLDAGTEAGLVATKQASTNLTGGVAYVPPVQQNQYFQTRLVTDSSGNVLGLLGPNNSIIALNGGVTTVPGAPTIGAVTAGDGTATVQIIAGTTGGTPLTGFTVTSSPAGGIDANAGTLTTPRLITGLTDGVPYTFSATSMNTVGTSAASAASSPAVTPGASVVVPGAPTVSATAGVASAQVSITVGNGGAPTGYTVTSNPAGGIDANAGTTVSPRTITGLTPNVPVAFTATASNTAGTSAASAASSPVTPTAPVAAAKSRAANSFAVNSVAI
jgi:hypothetical protein